MKGTMTEPTLTTIYGSVMELHAKQDALQKEFDALRSELVLNGGGRIGRLERTVSKLWGVWLGASFIGGALVFSILRLIWR